VSLTPAGPPDSVGEKPSVVIVIVIVIVIVVVVVVVVVVVIVIVVGIGIGIGIVVVVGIGIGIGASLRARQPPLDGSGWRTNRFVPEVAGEASSPSGRSRLIG
jgi:hypothetical protein